ncbi:MAG TPA: tetratricopeptide repeat protein [Chroococcales cyanobacterium]
MVVALLVAVNGCVAATNSAHDKWRSCLEQGDSHLQARRIGKAKTCYKQAISEIQKVGQSADEQALCWERLANAAAMEDDTDSAIHHYSQSLNSLERAYGADHEKLIEPLFKLGSIYESVGDHAAAMRHYNRAIRISEKNYSPYDPALLTHVSHLPDSSPRLFSKQPARRSSRLPQDAALSMPGLTASKQLLEQIDNHDKDLISEWQDTDDSLIEDFHKEILRRPSVSLQAKEVHNSNGFLTDSPQVASQKQIRKL